MADKKKGTEGGSASGTEAADKGAGKKAVVSEAAGESAALGEKAADAWPKASPVTPQG
jgi:hypothetical protein